MCVIVGIRGREGKVVYKDAPVSKEVDRARDSDQPVSCSVTSRTQFELIKVGVNPVVKVTRFRKTSLAEKIFFIPRK